MVVKQSSYQRREAQRQRRRERLARKQGERRAPRGKQARS